MNLKFIDRVIETYNDLPEADQRRLGYFRGLWEEMERWASSPSAEGSAYAVPTEEALVAAWNAEKPVFGFAAPKLKRDRFCAICAALRNYMVGQGGLNAEDAEEFGGLDFIGLVERCDIEGAAADPDAFLAGMLSRALEQGVSEGVARLAVFAGLLALRVDFEPAAKRVAKAQAKANTDGHNPLTCPVCGSAPALARVGGADSPTEGRGRTLYCMQCGNAWEFERVRCARCGTKNQGHLHFYNIEGDDAHRIATCDECGGYIRTVYIDEPLRPFSYEVEEVVTARLDALARDPKFNQE